MGYPGMGYGVSGRFRFSKKGNRDSFLSSLTLHWDVPVVLVTNVHPDLIKEGSVIL